MADNGDGTWTFTPTTDWNGAVSFDFAISDGTTSTANTASLSVAAVNDVPTTTGLADQALAEDFADYTIDLKTLFADVETPDANLIYTVSGNSNIGVSIDVNGVATISSSANWHGSETLTFTATDEGGASVDATADFIVNPVNDAAVFSGDTAGSGNEDTTIAGTLSVIDTADGMSSPNFTVTTDGTNGTATIDAAGNWSYTPTANWSGTDSFTVSVTDDDGNVESQIISITVNPVIDLTATDDSFSVDEDTTLSDTVATNDSTTSGGALSYTLNTDVTNGSLTLNADGSFSYTPTVNYNGSDSFTYTVTDAASGESATQTVAITVNPVNDEQVLATNTGAAVAEGSTGNVVTTAMLATTDVDNSSDQLVYTVDTAPANGTVYNDGVALSAGGSFTQADIDAGLITYDHDGSQTSSDAFAFTVDDGAGSTTAASFNITVSPVNDAPTAANNTVTTAEDTAYTFTAADFNFSDVDGDTLASVQITGLESVGSLQLNGVDVSLNQVITKADIDAGRLRFTPAADANGAGYDSFGFTVNDGITDSVSSYTMTVAVTAVNDAPIVTSPAVTMATENTAYSYTITTTDPDRGTSLTISAASLPTWLTLVDNGDGTATLYGTPTNTDVGNHSVVVTASDGLLTDTQPFTIAVSATATSSGPPADDTDTDTDDDSEPGYPTEAVPGEDPLAEADPGPVTDENLTAEYLSDPEESFVLMNDPQSGATQDIIYLTDENDADARSESRKERRAYTYFDNDLYKEIAAEEHLHVKFKAPEVSTPYNEFTDSGGTDIANEEWERFVNNEDYDRLREEIDETFQSERQVKSVKAKIVTASMTTFTVGIVSYFLRAGSMVASMVSTLPLWRGFDPIVIFSGKRKDKKNKEEASNSPEQQPETLFDRDEQ